MNSLDEQCARAWDQLEVCESALAKNTFLQSLRDQNWVLYYALVTRNLKELIPIIYTPTEVRGLYRRWSGGGVLTRGAGGGDCELFAFV